jgi:hypothetical protein
MPEKPDPFEDLLSAYAKERPVEPRMDRLTANIWQQIGHRRRGLGLAAIRGLGFFELFRHRPVVLSALAVAAVAAYLPIAWNRPAEQDALARSSLHFEFFSAEMSSVLPSGVRVTQR